MTSQSSQGTSGRRLSAWDSDPPISIASDDDQPKPKKKARSYIFPHAIGQEPQLPHQEMSKLCKAWGSQPKAIKHDKWEDALCNDTLEDSLTLVVQDPPEGPRT